ncbi:nuclear transport factor 2 family protein [Flavobacterium tegetincola]|uniref:nuclear transport factor 2 family protein n=1 Tax=Flavobacterium tegetincola TaxID=150172 RepID=UPI00041E4C0D|nr:nuclear transport factor 2 family protein [Flavobacterium tegetincola]
MKQALLLLSLLFTTLTSQCQNVDRETKAVHQIIDSWHKAASEADFATYFNLMSDNAIFIGTDATENWNKKEFQAYAKPHFDKGKAWSFIPLERNIYFSADQKTAWFDELLDTQMKICRGSGVLTKVNNEWKIAHYVLSINIPNELSNEIVKMKTAVDEQLLKSMRK